MWSFCPKKDCIVSVSDLKGSESIWLLAIEERWRMPPGPSHCFPNTETIEHCKWTTGHQTWCAVNVSAHFCMHGGQLLRVCSYSPTIRAIPLSLDPQATHAVCVIHTLQSDLSSHNVVTEPCLIKCSPSYLIVLIVSTFDQVFLTHAIRLVGWLKHVKIRLWRVSGCTV